MHHHQRQIHLPGDRKQLLGKLKYFSYRDNKTDHIPQRDENREPIRRWVNRGLGDGYHEIAQKADQLATVGYRKEVAARTLVVSPQIDMMEAIEPERQKLIIAELTETTIENWFEQMGYPTPEHSYVVHQGETTAERPDGTEKDVAGRRDFLHTHVILAATVAGLESERENYKVYGNQLQKLHKAGREEMERIWERELGRERVQELNQDLEALTQELEELDREREADQIERLTPSPQTIEENMAGVYRLFNVEAPDFQRPAPLEDGREDLAAWFPRDEPDIEPIVDLDL